MTTITELPLEPVRGPANLLHWLAKLPPALSPALTVVELTLDRRVAAASQVEVDLIAPAPWPQPVHSPFAVAVLWLPNSQTRERGLEYLLSLRTTSESALLDLLLVADGRWWSALCDDQTCCPPAGRSIRSGEQTVDESYRSWQVALNGGEVPATELLAALQHIEVRDAVLTQIIEPAGTARWSELRETLSAGISETDPAAAKSAAAFHCINAVLAYLQADSAAVLVELERARAFLPDYSFAKLLRQGIDNGAPPQLLLSAIRSCTDVVQSQIKCA